MIWDRLVSGRRLLSEDGLLWCTLDDNEKDRFREIAKRIFGAACTYPAVVWQHSIQGKGYTGSVSVGHNYVLPFGNTVSGGIGVLERTPEHNTNYSNPDNDPKGPWRAGDVRNALYRPNLVYDIPTPSGMTIKPPPKGWRWSWETMKQKIAHGEIVFSKDETRIIHKIYLEDQGGRVPESIWLAKEAGSTRAANGELRGLFGYAPDYTTAKPTALIDQMVTLSASAGGVVADYFAGSGATGHAVINHKRYTAGNWSFILVELADHFDSMLIPRIKKVTFTPEWKDGKPTRQATAEEAERSPRIVKYIRLESYDDALNNISFTDPTGQKVLEFDDYLLKYMLEWETKASETLLNVEKLARAFPYELNITEGQETTKKVVDIPETFNYLLGLDVRTRRVCQDKARRYLVIRGQIDHRRMVVIWRAIAGWQKKDYERDRKFIAEQKLAEGADEVFVNGDSLIANARALDPVFKARMFSEVRS